MILLCTLLHSYCDAHCAHFNCHVIEIFITVIKFIKLSTAIELELHLKLHRQHAWKKKKIKQHWQPAQQLKNIKLHVYHRKWHGWDRVKVWIQKGITFRMQVNTLTFSFFIVVGYFLREIWFLKSSCSLQSPTPVVVLSASSYKQKEAQCTINLSFSSSAYCGNPYRAKNPQQVVHRIPYLK